MGKQLTFADKVRMQDSIKVEIKVLLSHAMSVYVGNYADLTRCAENQGPALRLETQLSMRALGLLPW